MTEHEEHLPSEEHSESSEEEKTEKLRRRHKGKPNVPGSGGIIPRFKKVDSGDIEK
jgi:hypothetical protein